MERGKGREGERERQVGSEGGRKKDWKARIRGKGRLDEGGEERRGEGEGK